jgi:hypothetical protein
MWTPPDVRKFTARLQKVKGQVGISTFYFWFLDSGPVSYKMKEKWKLVDIKVTGQMAEVPF